jgi:hypothetical protein
MPVQPALQAVDNCLSLYKKSLMTETCKGGLFLKISSIIALFQKIEPLVFIMINHEFFNYNK